MHHRVGRRVRRGVGHLGGGDDVELTAEDALVGVHRLTARADEEQVGAERHGFLQCGSVAAGRTKPAASDHRSGSLTPPVSDATSAGHVGWPTVTCTRPATGSTSTSAPSGIAVVAPTTPTTAGDAVLAGHERGVADEPALLGHHRAGDRHDRLVGRGRDGGDEDVARLEAARAPPRATPPRRPGPCTARRRRRRRRPSTSVGASGATIPSSTVVSITAAVSSAIAAGNTERSGSPPSESPSTQRRAVGLVGDARARPRSFASSRIEPSPRERRRQLLLAQRERLPRLVEDAAVDEASTDLEDRPAHQADRPHDGDADVVVADAVAPAGVGEQVVEPVALRLGHLARGTAPASGSARGVDAGGAADRPARGRRGAR